MFIDFFNGIFKYRLNVPGVLLCTALIFVLFSMIYVYLNLNPKCVIEIFKVFARNFEIKNLHVEIFSLAWMYTGGYCHEIFTSPLPPPHSNLILSRNYPSLGPDWRAFSNTASISYSWKVWKFCLCGVQGVLADYLALCDHFVIKSLIIVMFIIVYDTCRTWLSELNDPEKTNSTVIHWPFNNLCKN